MFTRKIAGLLITSGFIIACFGFSVAQDATTQSATAQQVPDPQQQQEEKAKLERKAINLLEQIVTEAQALKLPENRIRVNIAAADILWDRSQSRARGLFADAGALLGQMSLDADRTDREEMQTLNQLRQDLVLTSARHDAELAYQLLRSTQPQTPATNAGNGRRFGPDPQTNLEQNLLATIAGTDPKVAYQKAAESLDKGEYPTALNRVLAQLQAKDQEAFKKLSDKTLNRLGTDNLVASGEAAGLALNLLRPGPRVTGTSTAASTDANKSISNQVLSESAFNDLMDSVITASLSVTSLGPVNTNSRGGGGRGPMRAAQPNQQTPPDDAQTRQNNARILLFGLQSMLPQIDQYVPERAQAVRQKLTDLGVGNNPMTAFGNQMRTVMQEGTSDSLVAAAGTAPPQMQSALYRQAAQKAVDEGNTERALQIANDHLDETGRNSIIQAVDFKRLATIVSPEKIDEINQKLARLRSDSDRV